MVERMNAVADARREVLAAKLKLEEAVVAAAKDGAALRPLAYQAGVSHETVRTMIARAGERS